MGRQDTSGSAWSERFRTAVRASEEYAQKVRKTRQMFLTEYAGRYFGESDAESRVNVMQLAGGAILPYLAVQAAPVIEATDSELAGFAEEFLGPAVEDVLREAHADEVVDAVCLDGLFGLGILLTGCLPEDHEGAGMVEPTGWIEDPGQPSFRRVSLDDFVWDHKAREWDGCWYLGHWQGSVPAEWAADCGLYDSDVIRQATRAGQSRREHPGSEIGTGSGGLGVERPMDEIDLLHLWLPRQGRVVSLAGDLDTVGRVARDVEWTGPEGGPYDLMRLIEVSDNLLPGSLLGGIYDLHMAINRVVRTLIEQAEQQKDVMTGPTEAEQLARKICDARTGQAFTGPGGDLLKVHRFGGMSREGIEALSVLSGLANRQAHNTETIAGLSSRAGTLGQEQMMAVNAAAPLGEARKRVARMVRSACRKIAWYVWHGQREIPIRRDMGGGRVETDVLRRGHREGEFRDFRVDVHVRVAGGHTAEEEYERLGQWFQADIAPFVDAAAAQGLEFDFRRYAEARGRLLGLKMAKEFWRQSVDYGSRVPGAEMGLSDPARPAPVAGQPRAMGAGTGANNGGRAGRIRRDQERGRQAKSGVPAGAVG